MKLFNPEYFVLIKFGSNIEHWRMIAKFNFAGYV